MEYTKEALDRKLKTQRLICMVNGWLLEHYEHQSELLDQVKNPAAGPSDEAQEDGNGLKGNSAYVTSIQH